MTYTTLPFRGSNMTYILRDESLDHVDSLVLVYNAAVLEAEMSIAPNTSEQSSV
jgi:hypothetical protein